MFLPGVANGCFLSDTCGAPSSLFMSTITSACGQNIWKQCFIHLFAVHLELKLLKCLLSTYNGWEHIQWLGSHWWGSLIILIMRNAWYSQRATLYSILYPYTPCGRLTTSLPRGECDFQKDWHVCWATPFEIHTPIVQHFGSIYKNRKGLQISCGSIHRAFSLKINTPCVKHL